MFLLYPIISHGTFQYAKLTFFEQKAILGLIVNHYVPFMFPRFSHAPYASFKYISSLYIYLSSLIPKTLTWNSRSTKLFILKESSTFFEEPLVCFFIKVKFYRNQILFTCFIVFWLDVSELQSMVIIVQNKFLWRKVLPPFP